jgi:hypothetical protein
MKMNKFRAWDSQELDYSYSDEYNEEGCTHNECLAKFLDFNYGCELEQFIGLTDNHGKEYYAGDKGRFDNGDTFVLRMEECLRVFPEWIGEPECEDQTRDLYRITRAEIVGNIHDEVKK